MFADRCRLATPLHATAEVNGVRVSCRYGRNPGVQVSSKFGCSLRLTRYHPASERCVNDAAYRREGCSFWRAAVSRSDIEIDALGGFLNCVPGVRITPGAPITT